MNIISPLTIDSTMIGAGTTISEPASGETAWVSGGSYTVGDLRIRATTHRVYACVQTHSGRTALPEVDSAYWLDKSPTQRYAPFDAYTSTAAATVTTMTYVMTPGYFNAVWLGAPTGSSYSFTVKDVSGGTTIYSRSGYLYDDPVDWYEYLFNPIKTKQSLLFTEIPPRPAAEMTLTITAATSAAVGIGMIAIGDYQSLSGTGQWGGTQYGASAEPVTYSYIKQNDDGTTTIVRRHAGTNLRCTIALPREEADSVLYLVKQVLDTPVAWIATGAPGYDGLSAFGLGSASMKYDSFGTASLDINVKGLI